MIINNMEALGKAIDDGVELEWLDDNSAKLGDYKTYSPFHWGMEKTILWVKEGRIRTKPKTVDVKLYWHHGEVVDCSLLNLTPSPPYEHTTHTITLEE